MRWRLSSWSKFWESMMNPILYLVSVMGRVLNSVTVPSFAKAGLKAN